MKVLILHSSSDLYGASKILIIVVQNLIRNGYIPIVVLSQEGPLSDQLRQNGVQVFIIRLGVLRRKYFSPRGLINRFSVMWKAGKKLKRLIKKESVSIIYSNTTGVLIGAFLARKLKIRHIWHVHEIINKPFLLIRMIGYLLDTYTDQVIVVSNAVKYHWSQWVSSDKLIMIHNGISLLAYEHPTKTLRKDLLLQEHEILIGMIGRVHYWKGQEYFLRIAGEISRKFGHVRFILVGDAFPGYEYLYDRLEKIIAEENLKGKVINLGYRTDIVDILNSLDIFVLPSTLPDPFPTVILEAMAAGKPIAATKQGGAIEMIEDGVSGILIPMNDTETAAKKFIKLIEDKDERRLIGINANKRVRECFSIDAFNNAILGVFK